MYIEESVEYPFTQNIFEVALSFSCYLVLQDSVMQFKN